MTRIIDSLARHQERTFAACGTIGSARGLGARSRGRWWRGRAQAVVAAESLLVLATEVVQAPNDKQQIEPMLGKIGALPNQLGKPEALLADSGYFSAANVTACEAAKIAPLIAIRRQPHHQSLQERFANAPPAPDNPTPVEAMAHRLLMPTGWPPSVSHLTHGLQHSR